MLHLILVLLAAQSALGASSVAIRLEDIKDKPYPVEKSNALVNSFLVDRAWETLDESDINIKILTVEQILKDLAEGLDPSTQATVACQTIAVIGELATGRSGDACAFSEFINANCGSGNQKKALANIISRLEYDINAITSLNSNSKSLRYQTGPRANCAGGGRTYNFEAAWDKILAASNPFQIGLVNEEYCAAKRLYNAWNERSNVIAAAVTACSDRSLVKVFERALPAVANYLRTLAYNGDVAKAASNAKSALLQAV